MKIKVCSYNYDLLEFFKKLHKDIDFEIADEFNSESFKELSILERDDLFPRKDVIYFLDINLFKDMHEFNDFTKKIDISEKKIIVVDVNYSLVRGPLIIMKGFKAYIPHTYSSSELDSTLNVVEQGKVFLHPDLMFHTIKVLDIDPELALKSKSMLLLNKKEQDFALLLVTGKSNKLISEELGVDASSIRQLIESIFTKINATDRISAALKLSGKVD